MLKMRVMPTLLFKGVGLVKGIGFDSWRRVGAAMQSIRVYNMREVDELVFLDISATAEDRPPDFETIDELADECFMPLTVGGGIRTVADVRRLLEVGADKVSVNSAAISNPGLIREISAKFGNQCVVVSIDCRKRSDGTYEVYGRSGSTPTGLEAAAWARQMSDFGAGEILLTSVERDGAMNGYDLDLIEKVTKSVNIPVIASGGAGSYADMASALRAGASAVAAASIFHFTEQTPREAKQFLSSEGFPVRL